MLQLYMKDKNFKKIIGLVAAFFTIIAFIPKAIFVYKTQKKDVLHLPTIILLLISQFFWIYDGKLNQDIGLMISSGFKSMLYIFFIYAIYRY